MTAAPADAAALLARFDAYDFDADSAFADLVTPLLNRLELAGGLTPAKRDDVLLRARCGWFSRYVAPLPYAVYLALRPPAAGAGNPPSAPYPPPQRSPLPPPADADAKPRAPAAFAAVGALIAAGRAGELVGRDVDDVTVHPQLPTSARSQPPAPGPKKPWERCARALPHPD